MIENHELYNSCRVEIRQFQTIQKKQEVIADAFRDEKVSNLKFEERDKTLQESLVEVKKSVENLSTQLSNIEKKKQ